MNGVYTRNLTDTEMSELDTYRRAVEDYKAVRLPQIIFAFRVRLFLENLQTDTVIKKLVKKRGRQISGKINKASLFLAAGTRLRRKLVVKK